MNAKSIPQNPSLSTRLKRRFVPLRSLLNDILRRRGSRFLVGLTLAAACGQAVRPPEVAVFDRSRSNLSLGTLNEVNGTYTGCIHHTDGDPWSAPIGGFSSLDNPALSVVEGDSACLLTVTSVLIDDDTYVPVTPIELGDSYLQAGVAFKLYNPMTMMPASQIAFFGNLKVSSASYAYGFSMSLVYSDDPRLTSGGSSNSIYRTTSASATEGQASPPDYTADSSTLQVQTNSAKTITAVSGSVDLTRHSVQGQNYVIDSSNLGASPSFDTLNTQFAAGTPVAITNNTNPSIAASDLGLVNDTGLATGNVKRNIIIQNLDATTGVKAYQAITVTIIPPT